MRVLTTNRHEIYLSLLAETGTKFDILVSMGSAQMPWREQYGAVPANARLIEWSSAVADDIRHGAYDAIVLHTIADLVFFRKFKDAKFIFVIHLALYSHGLFFKLRWLLKRLVLEFYLRFRRISIIAVSPWKLSTWKLGGRGRVILLAPTKTPQMSLAKGEVPKVITIGNHFAKRAELNFALLRRIRAGAPISVCGINPGMADAMIPKSREDLLDILAKHHIFVFTTEFPWNDGYNTSLLEAMECGLAVVGMEHPSSPILHGKSGYLAKSPEELVYYLDRLRKDPELIKKFGQKNQEIVRREFSREKFLSSWTTVLTDFKENQPTNNQP